MSLYDQETGNNVVRLIQVYLLKKYDIDQAIKKVAKNLDVDEWIVSQIIYDRYKPVNNNL